LSDLRRPLPALLAAGLLAGLVAWGISAVWAARFGHGTMFLKLGHVFVPMAVAILAYFGAALWAGVPAASEIVALLIQRAGVGPRR
jgi:hypothetical protein